MQIKISNFSELFLKSNVLYIYHTIGYWHEQSRPDRDNYIDIYWSNINPKMQYNFKKCKENVCSTQNHPYDYDSVMHYHTTAFGNGRQTMARKGCTNCKLGQRNGLSEWDVKGLNLLYGCSNTGGGGNTGGGTGGGGNTGGSGNVPPISPQPQGNPGGNGGTWPGTYGGGGGGGSGGAGGNSTQGEGYGPAGAGTSSSITGAAVTRASGGAAHGNTGGQGPAAPGGSGDPVIFDDED